MEEMVWSGRINSAETVRQNWNTLPTCSRCAMNMLAENSGSHSDTLTHQDKSELLSSKYMSSLTSTIPCKQTHTLTAYSLHRFEECLAVVLQCHDELQLGASRFHGCRKDRNYVNDNKLPKPRL